MSNIKQVTGAVHSDYGGTMQLLPIDAANSQFATTNTASSASFDITGFQAVRIAAKEDCFIRFGTSGVSASKGANSDFFPAGVETLAVPAGATHVAYIGDTANGHITVSKLGD